MRNNCAPDTSARSSVRPRFGAFAAVQESEVGTTVWTGRALQAEMNNGETGSFASVSGP